MIYIESKKKALKTLDKLYPNAKFVDVTSKGSMPYVKLSPFYPHGNIPIPFSEGTYSETVEGIWQGLKVFEKEDVDKTKFIIKNMKGIKRTIRKYGSPLGHRKGINGIELLDYISARKSIYLRAYAFVLQSLVKDIIESLAEDALKQDLVLLDFDTNEDIENAKKPLSHASLIKKHMEFRFPQLKTLSFSKSKIINGSKHIKTKTSKVFQLKKGTSKKNKLIENQLTIG